jgi:trimethylamine--corrinoid protein Co-methyltransferase
MSDTYAKSRRSGRKERLAQRAAPPAVNPAPAGQVGGQYRPLSGRDLKDIYDTALRLLRDLGMGEVPTRLHNDLIAAGAVALDNGRVSFPNALVEDAIASAAKTFVLHGRDPDRSIEVGGDRVYFGTGRAAVNTLDMDSGLYRPSTLVDLHNFTRLQDTLDNVAWFTRCCIATDLPDIFDLDVNTTYALLWNTTKPVATAFTIADHVEPIIKMLDIATGGEGEFAKRPFLKTHISPVISPMRYGEDAVEVVYECIKHNIPMSCITAAQAGATAPATMAGFLAQSLAETLASLVMVNVISPGFPMVFSNWPLVIDLRSGAFAGGNLIYESSGMTAALLGVSFEAFILDDEMHAMTYRALRGVEVSEENPGFDAICGAILGDGHFLGADHTYQAMERDYHYPKLADREQPRTWEENGALDAWARAKAKAQEVLTNHHPEYLTPDQDAQIKAAFKIVG